MRITITPKDPKLAKDPAVKKWLRHVEKEIGKIMESQNATAKIHQAIALGIPLVVTSSGVISLIEDFYSIAPKYRTKQQLINTVTQYIQKPQPRMTATQIKKQNEVFFKQLEYGPPAMEGFLNTLAKRIAEDPNVMDKLDMKKVERELKRIKHRNPRRGPGDHYE